jgi:transcriptional regulator with XRE-family HTH domain
MVSMLRPDGNRIKVLRIRKGWRREQLASNAGVRPRTIQRVEAGGNASFETLRSLATALEVDVCELTMQMVQTHSRRPRGERIAIRERASAVCDFVVSGFLPYVPAMKGILASFALVLLVAFAIRLSPMLADLEPEIGTIEPTQFISPTPRSAPATHVFIPAVERRSEVTPREQSVPPKVTTQNVATIPSAPPAEKTTANHPPLANEHAAATVQAESSPAKIVAHGQPAGIDIAWLASLVEQESGVNSRHSGGLTSAVIRTPEASSAGSGSEAANESVVSPGNSGGSNLLAKAFVKSGKSTASFFSKVGSGIKRAF